MQNLVMTKIHASNDKIFTECRYCKKVWQAQFECLGQIIGLVFNVIGVYRIITGVSWKVLINWNLFEQLS